MERQMKNYPQKYIFFLQVNNPEAAHIAAEFLREQRIKVLSNHENVALVALATADQVETASLSGMFAGIHKQSIKERHLDKLLPDQRRVVELWNTQMSERFRKEQAERSQVVQSWGAEDRTPPPPAPIYNPEDFKRSLLESLKVNEDELRAKYKIETPRPLVGDDFVEYESRLREAYGNPTIAYQLVRVAFFLEPFYQAVLLELPHNLVEDYFTEPPCWKMENKIAVGVVFVESSLPGGPKFSDSTRAKLKALIVDGLDWLAAEAPLQAKLTWVYNWQEGVKIDIPNGTSKSSDDYWRTPGIASIEYNNKKYTPYPDGLGDYRNDLRLHNAASHAVVIFVSPYATDSHARAFPKERRLFITNYDDYGNWGINTVNRIAAHEICHLFGAADEYTGEGTPCNTCGSTHGCYSLPNGNCDACAQPHQECIMDENSKRICAYTRGHIGWTDLFVELTTADDFWSGTGDTVWLDIGDQTFVLDTPYHDDRERGNVEGYALGYTGVSKNEIKRVGIRKSSDGNAGAWKIKRVRLWFKGELICDANNIDQWLEEDYQWWVCTTCGSSNQIVNTLRVKVTTADEIGAGTDDVLALFLGGRSWILDNPGHNDFEQGHTDTFDLDPGTGLYKSMLNAIHIHKFKDGDDGEWKLKGLEIIVNGSSIYNNQNINQWLAGNHREWHGNIP